MSQTVPFVSVITAVYNGEKYLAECIESVLSQTHQKYEYLIVNNCSTDRTLDIAQSYALKDERIRVFNNPHHVGAIENHNIALGYISLESEYCKIVCADDWLYPDCIERMVGFAERHPSVGIVGSYQLSGDASRCEVKWTGLSYANTIMSGRDICRWHLLRGEYIFGDPTSSLYRSSLVRKVNPFFPGEKRHSDAKACYRALQYADFGFVHQILSFERIHSSAQGTKARELNEARSDYIEDLLEYGPIYLSKDEFERRLSNALSDYYDFLAIGAFNFYGREFWKLHRKFLKDHGYPFWGIKFFRSLLAKGLDVLLNPKISVDKMVGRLLPSTSILQRTKGARSQQYPFKD